MLGTRLLLVDDDPGVLFTLEAVLRNHDYNVTSASNVSEAIHAIAHREFDILVTDLNIGEPGDGFTVVSALRRLQPNAVALIITGFPAFDNALQAIRQQVDDYLVKPVPPLDLVSTIERLRNTRTRHMPLPAKRASTILREDFTAMQGYVLRRMREYARTIRRTDLDDAALVDHLPGLLEELCNRVDENRTHTSEVAKMKSVAHGLLRRQQNLTPTFILNEASYIRDAVLQLIHQHLLNVDMSYLLVDLATINESLDAQLNIAMETMINGEIAA
jgi:ActR/RegA family two-component response regulator